MKVRRARFDGTELLLLASVVVALMAFFAWQNGMMPTFLNGPMVLGVSSIR